MHATKGSHLQGNRGDQDCMGWAKALATRKPAKPQVHSANLSRTATRAAAAFGAIHLRLMIQQLLHGLRSPGGSNFAGLFLQSEARIIVRPSMLLQMLGNTGVCGAA